jgi:hypothetical protein
MEDKKSSSELYGLMAEFDTPTEAVEAAKKTYAAGYRQLNAYSPYPIEELWEAIGVHRTILPLIIFSGGLIGGLGGFLMQWYLLTIDYPLNVGGKPQDISSWPAWIPVTFECVILLASLSAVAGMILLNRLPQPYHPVFNVPRFALASRDRFFLAIKSNDKKFDYEETKRFMQSLNPREVFDVEE